MDFWINWINLKRCQSSLGNGKFMQTLHLNIDIHLDQFYIILKRRVQLERDITSSLYAVVLDTGSP